MNERIILADRVAGFNSVLPSKVYGLWANRGSGWQMESYKLDEIAADTQALAEGRKKWGKNKFGEDVVRSAMLIPGKTRAHSEREPMFLNE